MNEGKKLARDHTDWYVEHIAVLVQPYPDNVPRQDVVKICQKIYLDSMEHGFKHGTERPTRHVIDSINRFQTDLICPACGVALRAKKHPPYNEDDTRPEVPVKFSVPWGEPRLTYKCPICTYKWDTQTAEVMIDED